MLTTFDRYHFIGHVFCINKWNSDIAYTKLLYIKMNIHLSISFPNTRIAKNCQDIEIRGFHTPTIQGSLVVIEIRTFCTLTICFSLSYAFFSIVKNYLVSQ